MAQSTSSSSFRKQADEAAISRPPSPTSMLGNNSLTVETEHPLTAGDLTRARGTSHVSQTPPRRRSTSRMSRRTSAEEIARNNPAVVGSPNPKALPPEGEVVFCFTDVQSSTELWESYTDQMSQAIRQHNELLREGIDRNQGYEVKTEGDAFFVVFESVVNALRWCMEMQDALLEVKWPRSLLSHPSCKLIKGTKGQSLWCGPRVRMGMHRGSAIQRKDPTSQRMDYFGPTVNKSARVSSLGRGGEIVASDEIIAELKAKGVLPSPVDEGYFILPGKLQEPSTAPSASTNSASKHFEILLRKLGEHKLKGISEPCTIYSMVSSSLSEREFPPLVIPSQDSSSDSSSEGSDLSNNSKETIDSQLQSSFHFPTPTRTSSKNSKSSRTNVNRSQSQERISSKPSKPNIIVSQQPPNLTNTPNDRISSPLGHYPLTPSYSDVTRQSGGTPRLCDIVRSMLRPMSTFSPPNQTQDSVYRQKERERQQQRYMEHEERERQRREKQLAEREREVQRKEREQEREVERGKQAWERQLRDLEKRVQFIQTKSPPSSSTVNSPSSDDRNPPSTPDHVRVLFNNTQPDSPNVTYGYNPQTRMTPTPRTVYINDESGRDLDNRQSSHIISLGPVNSDDRYLLSGTVSPVQTTIPNELRPASIPQQHSNNTVLKHSSPIGIYGAYSQPQPSEANAISTNGYSDGQSSPTALSVVMEEQRRITHRRSPSPRRNSPINRTSTPSPSTTSWLEITPPPPLQDNRLLSSPKHGPPITNFPNNTPRNTSTYHYEYRSNTPPRLPTNTFDFISSPSSPIVSPRPSSPIRSISPSNRPNRWAKCSIPLPTQPNLPPPLPLPSPTYYSNDTRRRI